MSQYSDLLRWMDRMGVQLHMMFQTGSADMISIRQVSEKWNDIMQAVKERDDLRGQLQQLEEKQLERFTFGGAAMVEPHQGANVVYDRDEPTTSTPLPSDMQFTCDVQCGSRTHH